MGLSPVVFSHTAMQRAAGRLRANGTGPVTLALVSAADGPDLSEAVTVRAEVAFADMEDLPESWRADPGGHFVLGAVSGVSAVAWASPAGAVASAAEAAYGARVAVELGIEVLVTCAPALALNPTWSSGDLAVVSDHINVSGRNPLVGPNVEAHGFRFPDMSFVYDADLRQVARAAAVAAGALPREGTVAGVTSLEDVAADARILRTLGADAMTLGIVPDAIAARHATRRVAGLAVVRGPATHPAAGDAAATDPATGVDLIAIVKAVAATVGRPS